MPLRKIIFIYELATRILAFLPFYFLFFYVKKDTKIKLQIFYITDFSLRCVRLHVHKLSHAPVKTFDKFNVPEFLQSWRVMAFFQFSH